MQKIKNPDSGKKRAKTHLYDEIVKTANAESGVLLSESTHSKTILDRTKVRLHTQEAMRWAILVEICGWLAAILLDWPKTSISRPNEPAFKSFLTMLKSKTSWLRETAAQYFESKVLGVICSTGTF